MNYLIIKAQNYKKIALRSFVNFNPDQRIKIKIKRRWTSLSADFFVCDFACSLFVKLVKKCQVSSQKCVLFIYEFSICGPKFQVSISSTFYE